MFGKYLAASVALVLGTTAAMTAQANYYAQQPMQQPMMQQPMMVQQPVMMAPAPAPVVAPTIVVNNTNTQQQVSQQASQQAYRQPMTVDQMLQRCGIGGMLTGNTSPALASLTNITTWSGTLASLSGSSSPDTCASPQYRAAAFIKESITELEVDLAMGAGTHLQALNSVVSCQTVTQNLRNEYAEYAQTSAYTVSTQATKVQKMFEIVDANLSSSACSA